MRLTKHDLPDGTRWAADGRLLAPGATLGLLLGVPAGTLPALIAALTSSEPAPVHTRAPIDDDHEVWACGVTYTRSRDARMAESSMATVYDRVYDAERPEVFYKAAGWRVSGTGAAVRVRADSAWNVPEPEVVLVVNRFGEIVGYTAGDDVSSRDIEGANPLYLPQAKIYNGACALGDAIVLAGPQHIRTLTVDMTVTRDGGQVFAGQSSPQRMKRTFEALVSWLTRELSFPKGVFVMTGTGIVPDESFTLRPGDNVVIHIGDASLTNIVAA